MIIAELADYQTSKGTVQFPYDKPLPLELVSKMVRFRVAEQEALAKAKSAPKPLNEQVYRFQAEIKKVPDMGGAYVGLLLRHPRHRSVNLCTKALLPNSVD